MTIRVRQLHPIFVGEVSAVDLAADLPPDTVADLTRAIDRYAVLVFQDSRSTTTGCSPSAACSETSNHRAIIASSAD